MFALSSAFLVLKNAMDVDIMVSSAEKLSVTTGVSYAGVAKSMKEVTQGALSMQEALRAASIGISSGLSGKQMQQVAEIATKAANALGRSVPDAINRMTQAVVKNEPELVDEFGIILRVDEATKDYAQTLGKTKSELTSFDRQMAIHAQLVKQGTAKFGNVEGQVNSYNKLGAVFTEMTHSLISFINDGLTPLANLLSENKGLLAGIAAIFAKGVFNKAIPELKNMTENLQLQRQEYAKLINQKTKDVESVGLGVRSSAEFDVKYLDKDALKKEANKLMKTLPYDVLEDEFNSSIAKGIQKGSKNGAKYLKDSTASLTGGLENALNNLDSSSKSLNKDGREYLRTNNQTIASAQKLVTIRKILNKEIKQSSIDVAKTNIGEKSRTEWLQKQLLILEKQRLVVKDARTASFTKGATSGFMGGGLAEANKAIKGGTFSFIQKSGIRIAGIFGNISGIIGGMMSLISGWGIALFAVSTIVKPLAGYFGLINKEVDVAVGKFNDLTKASENYNKSITANEGRTDITGIVAKFTATAGALGNIADQVRQIKVLSKATKWDRLFNLDFRTTDDYIDETVDSIKELQLANESLDLSSYITALEDSKSKSQDLEETAGGFFNKMANNWLPAIVKGLAPAIAGMASFINKYRDYLQMTTLGFFFLDTSEQIEAQKELDKEKEKSAKINEEIAVKAEAEQQRTTSLAQDLKGITDEVSDAIKKQGTAYAKLLQKTPYGTIYTKLSKVTEKYKELNDGSDKYSESLIRMQEEAARFIKAITGEEVKLDIAINFAEEEILAKIDNALKQKLDASKAINAAKKEEIKFANQAARGEISAIERVTKAKLAKQSAEIQSLDADRLKLEIAQKLAVSSAKADNNINTQNQLSAANLAISEHDLKVYEKTNKLQTIRLDNTKKIQTELSKINQINVSQLKNKQSVLEIEANIAKNKAKEGGEAAILNAFDAEKLVLLAKQETLQASINKLKKEEFHEANRAKDTTGEIAVLQAKQLEITQKITQEYSAQDKLVRQLAATQQSALIDTLRLDQEILKAKMDLSSVEGSATGSSAERKLNVLNKSIDISNKIYQIEVKNAKIQEKIAKTKVDVLSKEQKTQTDIINLEKAKIELINAQAASMEIRLEHEEAAYEMALKQHELAKQQTNAATIFENPKGFTDLLGKEFAILSKEFSESIMNPVDRAADSMLRVMDTATDTLYDAIAAGENVGTAMKDALIKVTDDITREITTDIMKQWNRDLMQNLFGIEDDQAKQLRASEETARNTAKMAGVVPEADKPKEESSMLDKLKYFFGIETEKTKADIASAEATRTSENKTNTEQIIATDDTRHAENQTSFSSILEELKLQTSKMCACVPDSISTKEEEYSIGGFGGIDTDLSKGVASPEDITANTSKIQERSELELNAADSEFLKTTAVNREHSNIFKEHKSAVITASDIEHADFATLIASVRANSPVSTQTAGNDVNDFDILNSMGEDQVGLQSDMVTNIMSGNSAMGDGIIGAANDSWNLLEATNSGNLGIMDSLKGLVNGGSIGGAIGQGIGGSTGGMLGGLLDAIFFANGGVTNSLNRYAGGGVTDGAEIAMIGDNSSGKEAIVPLPDGETIPVEFTGDTAGGDTIINTTVNITGTDTNNAEAVRRSAGQVAQAAGQATSRAMQRNG